MLKENFGVEPAQKEICSLIYEYHKIARGYTRLYPDVAETLVRLKEEYIRNGKAIPTEGHGLQIFRNEVNYFNDI